MCVCVGRSCFVFVLCLVFCVLFCVLCFVFCVLHLKSFLFEKECFFTACICHCLFEKAMIFVNKNKKQPLIFFALICSLARHVNVNDNAQLSLLFSLKVRNLLAKYGKRMILWEEPLKDRSVSQR